MSGEVKNAANHDIKLMEKEETSKATDETYTQLTHDHWILVGF